MEGRLKKYEIKHVHHITVVLDAELEYVDVDLTTACDGFKDRRRWAFLSLDRWEFIRALGYFMA